MFKFFSYICPRIHYSLSEMVVIILMLSKIMENCNLRVDVRCEFRTVGFINTCSLQLVHLMTVSPVHHFYSVSFRSFNDNWDHQFDTGDRQKDFIEAFHDYKSELNKLLDYQE